MARYPKYATTVIGAYSVPDWFESLDRLPAVGQLAMASMADAQFRATQAAVLDQAIAGIDVVTGGEMHRRTHNRHSPPGPSSSTISATACSSPPTRPPRSRSSSVGTRSISCSPMWQCRAAERPRARGGGHAPPA
jgi:hypothetical protein